MLCIQLMPNSLAKTQLGEHVLCTQYLRAPEEVPTSTAVGAASPSAQGQATTSTLHASCRLSSKGAAAPPTPPPPYLLSTCIASLFGGCAFSHKQELAGASNTRTQIYSAGMPGRKRTNGTNLRVAACAHLDSFLYEKNIFLLD